jgi:hypothetical protein
LKLYLSTRGFYALNEITNNSRFKPLIRNIHVLYNIAGRALATPLASKLIKRYRGKSDSSTKCKNVVKAIYLGYLHGIKWGQRKSKEISRPIDIYREHPSQLFRVSYRFIRVYMKLLHWRK